MCAVEKWQRLCHSPLSPCTCGASYTLDHNYCTGCGNPLKDS